MLNYLLKCDVNLTNSFWMINHEVISYANHFMISHQNQCETGVSYRFIIKTCLKHSFTHVFYEMYCFIVQNKNSENVWFSPYSAKRLFLKLNDSKRLIAFTIRSKRNVRHYNIASTQRSRDTIPMYIDFHQAI